MGCNAWNHTANCNCGWGGDTGGGRGRGSWPVRTFRVTDGFTWRFDRKPTYASYVDPNATCPVCGASVYFYQSPYGGRVFFDELGPPWPKHPCTDNGPTTGGGIRGHNYVFAPTSLPKSITPPLHARDAWRPLLADEIARIDEFDRIRLPQRDRLPGIFIYVPSGWVGDAPAFWRWCPSDPRMIEISGIRLPVHGSLETTTLNVPSWLRNDEEFERWRADPNAELSPEALNAIGFSLSFAWRLHEGTNWYLGLPCVDFALAKTFFELAAERGFWAAANNLAVMYRDGLGVERDLEEAFKLFQRAAQSFEPTPLKHLARCYGEGLGCKRDPELQSFLEELMALHEEEEKSTA